MSSPARAGRLFGIAAVAAICTVAALVLIAAVPSVESEGAGSDEGTAIALAVGDTFSYDLDGNMGGTEILYDGTVREDTREYTHALTGTALASYGGFLSLADGILTGAPDKTGTYTLGISTSWEEGGAVHSRSRTLTLEVSEELHYDGGYSASSGTLDISDRYFSFYVHNAGKVPSGLRYTLAAPSGKTIGSVSPNSESGLGVNLHASVDSSSNLLYIEFSGTADRRDGDNLATQISPTLTVTYSDGTTAEVMITVMVYHYTLKFDANGGSGAPSSLYSSGSGYCGLHSYRSSPSLQSYTFTVPSASPTYSGHSFAGWAESESAASADYRAGDSVTWTATGVNNSETRTLYAVWTTAPDYTVTVTAGTGGTVSGGGSYTSGSTITLRASAGTGYTFSEWSDGDTNAVRTITVNGNASYTATFKPNTYTVNFDANGGEGTMASETFTYDESKALTSNVFTKEGFGFAGWAVSKNATAARYTDGQSVSNLAASGTVTLYAVWTEIHYTVTFYDVDGKVIFTQTVKEGESVQEPEHEFEKDGVQWKRIYYMDEDHLLIYRFGPVTEDTSVYVLDEQVVYKGYTMPEVASYLVVAIGVLTLMASLYYHSRKGMALAVLLMAFGCSELFGFTGVFGRFL